MRNIKKIMREEFSSITPKQSEQLRQTEIVVKKKEKRSFKKLIAPVCALLSCCCCALCLIFLLPTDETFALGSYISLSFNPSLSILVDDDGNVEKIFAENYDAEIVINGMSQSGAEVVGSLQDVIYDVICESQNLGYFEEVDIVYVEIYCYQEDERALKVISEKINEVLSSAISGKEISISEMKREDILQRAKEIDDGITEDVDAEKLQQTMREGQSYSKKLQENIGENSEGLLEVYDLQILSCTMAIVEDMQKIYQEIQEICQKEGFLESEIFSSDNQRIKELCEEYSKKLEWFGLDLTTETFGMLLSDYEPLTEEKNQLSQIIENFKEKGEIFLDSIDKNEILKNETIANYYTLACDKHSISQNCTAEEILSAITELELSARLNKFGN